MGLEESGRGLILVPSDILLEGPERNYKKHQESRCPLPRFEMNTSRIQVQKVNATPESSIDTVLYLIDS
jgi:hypothetical protein